NLGGGMQLVNNHTAFLARYNANGGYVSDTIFPAGTDEWGDSRGMTTGSSVDVDSAGNVVLGGSFDGSVDFGDGTVATCYETPFVLKFDPTP
ncbi:MAG TPA: hypothetical protein VGB96_01050, partial [Archangium sp.]